MKDVVKLIYIGKSIAVCENCLIRCDMLYEDSANGRVRLTRCSICGNGDPQLDEDDWNNDNIDPDIRFFLWLMKNEG